MRTILVGACLGMALDAAMPAGALALDDWPLPRQGAFFSEPGTEVRPPALLFAHDTAPVAEAPTYAAGMRFELRYRVETTDRFDPANLKILGGAIGGNGVKGGAVVSLSWPTEH